MAVHNLGENVKTGIAVSPQALAAGDATGVVIDRKGFYGAVFTVLAGVDSGTPTSFTLDAKIQECDTSGGTYTDVSGATLTTITTEDTGGEINVDLNSLQRYVKVIITSAFVDGTTPAILTGASYTLGLPNVGGV